MKTKLNLSAATLVATGLFFLSSAAVFAGSKSKAAEERGMITSVDSNAHRIVVTDHKTKAVRTFQWNDQTKFTEQARAVDASALKEGLPVDLTYVTDSGTLTLQHVKLSPKKGQQHASAAPASQPKP